MNPTLEELQFIGFLQMCAESIKIIYSCKEIFLQLTLTLITPLLVVFYIRSKVSDEFGNVDEIDYYLKYWVIEATYFTFIVIFFLLSTSTIVYIVACVFSHDKPSYKATMSFVPKVWKKLVITMLCNLAIFVVYIFFPFLALVIFLSVYLESDTTITKIMLFTIYLCYFIGFVYISVIGQLASIVSVLEDRYGFQAIAKSKVLILGKMGISATIFVEVGLCLDCIHNLLIEKIVMFGVSSLVMSKVGFGGVFLVLRCLLFLLGLVVQTVIYFVCESSSDTTTLCSHVDAHLCGYVPLESRDAKV